MSESIQNLLGLLILIAVPLSFFLYGKFVVRLRHEGGKVRTDWVGLPDIPMMLVLSGTMAGLAITGLLQAKETPSVMQPDQILPGMIFLLVLGGGIAIFLVARRLGLIPIFGLREVSPPRALGWSFLLLLAAVPAVLAISIGTVKLLGAEAKEQDLVSLFTEVTRRGDFNTVFLIGIAGVIVAPICEEVLFRGSFYPVAKRYLGAGVGAFLTAALFAAFHLNLASLPGLLALALTFIIAYERTGSLLVPISMHALFNGANLLLLYLTAHAMA